MVPSPLLYDGVLYFIKNGGILTALDPATGLELKVGRVKGALGGYSASPASRGHWKKDSRRIRDLIERFRQDARQEMVSGARES